MKRSEINAIVAQAQEFMDQHGFALPPFAHWSPEQLRASPAAQIRARGLGWDITDYGQGRFGALGLVLFTLRNGTARDLARGRGMLYAEKAMISRVGQLSPLHRHVVKAEDIINRAGGDLVVELYASDAQGAPDPSAPVEITCDGQLRQVAAGGRLRLDTGESVTLLPGTWHAFWAEGADCLIGEVSTVNDDLDDNVFRDPVGRFAQIEEDVAPVRLLVSDYS